MSTLHVLPKFLLIDNFNLKTIHSFENMQYNMCYRDFKYYIYNIKKGKVIPLQARCGPEGG